MGKNIGAPAPKADPDLATLRSADISFDEQIEIIGEINEVLERNRIKIKEDTFSFTPKKQGTLIPLLINGGAVVVLLAVAFLLLTFFNQEERSLISASATVLTAEGRLISALREESKQKLNEKDRQIADIRLRLDDVRRQAELLKRDSEAQVLQAEEKLRAILAEELEAERLKLREAGLSSVAIEDQLRALEQKLAGENRVKLEAFRKQAREELAAKEAELATREEQYAGSLRRFEQEREALQQQFGQREADLRRQLQQQAAEAQSAQARTVAQLDALRGERERERLISDQIHSSYLLVNDSLRAGRSQTALDALTDLESYLSQPSIAGLPVVQERLPVERFLIASLRRLIEAERSPAAAAPQVSAAAADTAVLDSLRAELEQARAASERQARELDGARSGLDQSARELDQARSTISRQEQELSRLKSTLGQQSQELARSQAATAKQAALQRQAAALRQGYSAARGTGAAQPLSQQKVLDLVDTKLRVREVLSSEAVKAEHPQLYEDMEEYFDSYGKVQLQAGREEALQSAIAVLDDLLGRGQSDLAALKNRYGSTAPDLFARFLEKLEALLR